MAQSSWIKALTPKDTEEVKPGLFIQTRGNPDSLIDRLEKTVSGIPIKYPWYKEVWPAAWNGRVKWYNFILGGRFWSTTLWFLIVMFLAWAYYHDVSAYKDFYERATSDPIAFCSDFNNPNRGAILNEHQNVSLILDSLPKLKT